MSRECRLTAAWGETAPVYVTEASIESFVRDVLFADARNWPVLMLSVQEAGGYAISPESVANELLGLARVYHLDAANTSFRHTDLLGGKELSCFWGAARVYLPRFSCADDPFDHPLLFPDELLDPASRAELVGELAVGVRDTVPVAEGIAARRARRHRPRQTTETSDAPAVKPREAEAASPPTPVVSSAQPSITGGVLAGSDAVAHAIGAVATQLEVLAQAVSKLATANRELFEEVAQLRTGNAVRLASIASIERRIERIDSFVLNDIPRLLSPQADRGSETIDADEENDAKTALVDIVRQASTRHADALLVLENAEESAVLSPHYKDVDRVAKDLDAMAEIARRRQQGTLEMPVRQMFRDYAIDYRATIAESTPGKQRSQYLLSDRRGQTYECLELIVLGSNHNPRYCLRIYFTSRAPLEQRFVIGHDGRHFDVITTT